QRRMAESAEGRPPEDRGPTSGETALLTAPHKHRSLLPMLSRVSSSVVRVSVPFPLAPGALLRESGVTSGPRALVAMRIDNDKEIEKRDWCDGSQFSEYVRPIQNDEIPVRGHIGGAVSTGAGQPGLYVLSQQPSEKRFNFRRAV